MILGRAPAFSAAVVALAALAPAAAHGPAGGAVDVRRDVVYGVADGRPLLLDAYLPPPGHGRRPAVVMVHGGGWRTGDKESWAPEARKVAGRGWVAVSVNYRLDEPSPFPAEVDDVQAAVRWVRAHAGELGVDPGRIAAVGDSAGGHLVAMLATLGEGPQDTGARIRAGAAWSPPTDLVALTAGRGGGWAARLIGCAPLTCAGTLAAASPVTHVDATDAPLFLANSTDELVPLSQARAMADRLAAAGVDHRLVVYPGARHALDFRDDAWAPTVAFLEEHLAARKTASPGWLAGGLAAVAALLAAVLGALRRGRI